MTITQLQYFVVLAETKNFTRAANQLYITQPTLSQQIKKLEEELGYQLLIRRKKETLLTDSGQVFYESAKRMLEEYQQGLDQLKITKDYAEGELSIGLLWTFGYAKIDQLLNQFQLQYPKIHFSIHIDGSINLLSLVHEGKIDCAFIAGSISDYNTPSSVYKKALHYDLCKQSPLVLLAHKDMPLAKKKTLYYKDLDQQPFLHISQNSSMYKLVDDCLKQEDSHPNILGYSSLGDVALQAAESKLCYALVAQETFDHTTHNNIVSIPILPIINRQIWLVYREDQTSKIISTFQSFTDTFFAKENR